MPLISGLFLIVLEHENGAESSSYPVPFHLNYGQKHPEEGENEGKKGNANPEK
ncbi:hypothetical protein [Desulfoscipio geothermicus]|uniref:hypothetical protein n=1 Tax=Desulfoscipio geothermicus TaxID=39060 RepID=UPI0013F4E209|nr:hypothetical protein [Desulfoscipio geothermicus]